MTSLFCSASTTASCTHFIAVSKSTISPLRTPRDGVWPTPRILRVPSVRLSPTTTQILEVPISRPIIKLLLAIVLVRFLLVAGNCLGRRRRIGASFRRRRCMDRDCLHDARLHCGRDRIVNDRCRTLGESHRNVPLHKQVYGPEFLL